MTTLKKNNAPSLKEQEQFILYLAQKYNISTQADFEKKMKELGELGIQKEYAEFQQAKKQAELKKVAAAAHGAKLNYIRQLSHKCPEGYDLYYFKNGGSVGCGCKKKKKMSDGAKVPVSWRTKFQKHRNGGSLNGIPFIKKELLKVE